MIHLGTAGKRTRLPAIGVAQIAAGQGDAYLGALNQAVSAWARPIYIRPLAEMNNPGNPWSGDPAAYRKAFARIDVIVHGGAQAAARLAKLRLAPYRGPALAANPFPRVRVLWSPLAGGSDPKQYWPGAAYVDVGGADIYKEAGREPPWQKFGAIYAFVRAQHRQFAVPEWGTFGVDDPTFVQHMCTFLKQHPTETEEFYESKPGSIFDLGNKPASRAAYRACIAAASPGGCRPGQPEPRGGATRALWNLGSWQARSNRSTPTSTSSCRGPRARSARARADEARPPAASLPGEVHSAARRGTARAVRPARAAGYSIRSPGSGTTLVQSLEWGHDAGGSTWRRSIAC